MFLMVGILPVSAIILFALHLTVRNEMMRMLLVVAGTIGCFVTGMMHFMFIGVVLLCVEIIINKLTHSNG